MKTQKHQVERQSKNSSFLGRHETAGVAESGIPSCTELRGVSGNCHSSATISESSFEGFQEPNFTPVPDEFFDLFLPDLTGAELKVFLYIVRRTLGFKRREDAVSLGQICEGITTRDGRRLDRGTGLVRSTAALAASSLVTKGLLKRVQRKAPNGSHLPSLYQIRYIAQQVPSGAAPSCTKPSDIPSGAARRRSEPHPPSPVDRTSPSPLQRTTPSPTGRTHNKQLIQETVESKGAQRKAEQEAVKRAIEAFGLGKPDDAIMNRVLKAGNGANGFQIASYLYDRLKFIQRNPQHAPKSLGWFPRVVTDRFRSGDFLEMTMKETWEAAAIGLLEKNPKPR